VITHDEEAAASQLATLIGQAAQTQKPARQVIKLTQEFFEQRGCGPGVTIVNCGGGTQQIRNRLGQKAVQQSPDLAIFFLKADDSLDGVVHWLEGAFNGRHGNIRPKGPVAVAQQSSSSSPYRVVAVVHAKPTAASKLAAHLFQVESVDARSRVEPTLPASEALFYLRSSTEQDEYADIEGARYTFKSSIPNGLNLNEGAIVVTGNTKKSKVNGGCITGIGRVGRRLAHGDQVSAYYDRFLLLSDPIPLADVGDPTNNVNSITRVKRDWMLSVMKELGVQDVDSLPVPIHELTHEAVTVALNEAGLVIDRSLVRHCVTALRSGKNLILTGAPGTGKTSLALVLAETAASRRLSGEPMLTTGTADWSSVETVGAYRLTTSSELEFHPGHVTLSMDDDRWLVIDELNRADIDKAIGQLFTVLSGHAVTLPFTSGSESVGSDGEEGPGGDRFISIVPPGADIPEGTDPVHVSSSWRLLATLNDRDQDLLFSLSEALMRRFAVVEVVPPTRSQWEQILALRGGSGRKSWDDAMSAAVAELWKSGRPLGAAVLLDCIGHLHEASKVALEEGYELDEQSEFAAAWNLYVRPQLRSESGLSVEIDVASLFKSPPSDNATDGVDPDLAVEAD
jgi:MoxR-like ATPase